MRVRVPSAHSCAIQAGSGAVVRWGSHDWLQATPPASVNGTAGAASAIAAGGNYTLAIALPEPEQVTSLLAGCTLLIALPNLRRAVRMASQPASSNNASQGSDLCALNTLISVISAGAKSRIGGPQKPVPRLT